MKEGLEYIALSSVCKVQNGFAFNSKLFNETNKGLPLIRIRDIKRGYSLTYTDEACSNDFYVEDGDMLIGMDGDFNIGEWKGGHALLNQRVCKLIPSDKILAKFIFYFIPEALQRINDKTAFSTVKHLSSKQVNAILLPNLPLSEQQSIVDYLDSAFAKIDAMKANAEKRLNEAKALFQASLKKMLEPKEGWEEKTLKETCSVITDGTHHSPVNTANGKYKYVTAKNIKPWGLDLRNITFVSEDVHKEIVSRCCPQKGDVLYIKDGATTGIAIVNPLDEEFSLLSSVALIRPNKNIMLSEYLCYALNSPSIYEQTRSQMDGAAITRVTLVKIKGFTIPLPPLSEQQSIVETLDSLKSKVDRLQANYEKISQECDALKQAILRQVFE